MELQPAAASVGSNVNGRSSVVFTKGPFKGAALSEDHAEVVGILRRAGAGGSPQIRLCRSARKSGERLRRSASVRDVSTNGKLLGVVWAWRIVVRGTNVACRVRVTTERPRSCAKVRPAHVSPLDASVQSTYCVRLLSWSLWTRGLTKQVRPSDADEPSAARYDWRARGGFEPPERRFP